MYKRFMFAGALLALAIPAQAEDISGHVVGVTDGDTLTLLDAGKTQYKIRLGDIDAPESSQAYGTRSKQSLSDLCFDKDAVVRVLDHDRYGRTVGRITCAGVDANLEQVRAGMAWVYRQYLRDQALLTVEAEARQARRGLWADANPTPPWDYRRGKTTAPTTAPSEDPAPAAVPAKKAGVFSCETPKSTCGQMSSCAEARFYLESCGLSRLDRDHDGVPCESLCR